MWSSRSEVAVLGGARVPSNLDGADLSPELAIVFAGIAAFCSASR